MFIFYKECKLIDWYRDDRKNFQSSFYLTLYITEKIITECLHYSEK